MYVCVCAHTCACVCVCVCVCVCTCVCVCAYACVRVRVRVHDLFSSERKQVRALDLPKSGRCTLLRSTQLFEGVVMLPVAMAPVMAMVLSQARHRYCQHDSGRVSVWDYGKTSPGSSGTLCV